MSKLEIQNLIFRHCGPINLSVEAGECVCIFGKSGAGKSLLLRAVADIDQHKGKVLLNGKEQMDFQPTQWRKLVAMLPAENRWWKNRVGQHFNGKPIRLLEKLGFNSNVFDWEIARLSTGESQRLALVRLLMNEPEVLLLDEASAGLDTKSTSIVEEVVKNYLEEKNAAVVWVSHDKEQAKRIAKKHFLFKEGNIQRV